MDKELCEKYLLDNGWTKVGLVWENTLITGPCGLFTALYLQVQGDAEQLIRAWYELKELKAKATAPTIRNIPLTQKQRDDIASLWGALAESIMYKEAVASVALDHDPDMQTMVDPHCVGGCDKCTDVGEWCSNPDKKGMEQ